MDKQEVSAIIAKVVGEMLSAPAEKAVPAEVSARHIHLSAADVEALFGKGHTLTPKRPLSQPGQFLSEERLAIVTPKGEFRNVAVLGPARKETQVELSLTDAKALGVAAPIRQSGNTQGAGEVYLVSDQGMLQAKGSAIVAQNHVHMTPADAAAYGVQDGELVQVRMQTRRPLTFDDVVVRVNENFALALHIDFDEANACAFEKGATALLTRSGSAPRQAAPAASVAVPAAPAAPQAQAPAAPAKCESLLITETAAKAMLADGKKTVVLCPRAILTPMAKDVFSAARVKVERK